MRCSGRSTFPPISSNGRSKISRPRSGSRSPPAARLLEAAHFQTAASLDEFLHDVLSRIVTNLLAVRGAVILEREVRQTIDISHAEVLRWFVAQQLIDDRHVLDCVPEDKLFPVRLEVETSTGAFGWVLIGPRPDGSIAGKDEQKAVRNISSILGRSIRIVLTREQEKQEMLRLLEAHSLRIEHIEKLLKLRT